MGTLSPAAWCIRIARGAAWCRAKTSVGAAGLSIVWVIDCLREFEKSLSGQGPEGERLPVGDGHDPLLGYPFPSQEPEEKGAAFPVLQS